MSALPHWAAKIAELIDAEGLTQQVFAVKLNVTQSTVSTWVTGRKEPKAEMYFRIAKLWPRAPQVPFLLHRAADISGSTQLPGFEQMIKAVRRPPELDHRSIGKVEDDVVRLPLLKDARVAGEPGALSDKDIDRLQPAALSMCPHPDRTVCFRIKGDSMSPILEDGYIVAVDLAQADRARLHNQMVAARDPNGAVIVKWLRNIGPDEILVSQNTSKRHQPVVLLHAGEEEAHWEIIGKVLWWVGTPN